MTKKQKKSLQALTKRWEEELWLRFVSRSPSGPRGRGRCRCGFSLKRKMAALSAAALWSAPAGLWRRHTVSAGKSDCCDFLHPWVWIRLLLSSITLSPLSSRFGSDPSRYVVRVGASEQTVTPEQVVVHRKFKGQSGGHDLALLKLPNSKGHCLTFDPDTNAACLPPADRASGGSAPSSCVVMVTAGWTGAGGCCSLERVLHFKIKRDAAWNTLSIRRQRVTQHFYHARIY